MHASRSYLMFATRHNWEIILMSVQIKQRSISFWLKTIPYFQGLDDEIIKSAAQEVHIRRYGAGEVIFLEGDRGAGLHLVVEGLCKVYYLSPEGREHILYKLAPGDFCNEVSAVDGGPNPANFATISDSALLVVTERAMTRLRQQYPVLNDIVIKNLALHCRQLARRVYQLSFLSVTGRLAFFLIQQSDAEGTIQRQQWPQHEIAAYLGTVREMVGRSIKELRQANLIAVTRKTIQILDHAGLQQIAAS